MKTNHSHQVLIMTASRIGMPVVEIHDQNGATPIQLSEAEYAFCETIARRIFERIDTPAPAHLRRPPQVRRKN